jgi:hypothetical protein
VRTIILIFAAAALSAQTPKPEVDWAAINQKLDAVRAAVEARDAKKTSETASALWHLAVDQYVRVSPKPADYLQMAEQKTAASPRNRAAALPYIAKLAFRAGDLEKAGLYAREALDNPSPDATGDSIHDGNMVLGLIALKNGDVAAAKAYLLAAGRTTGTTISKRFGPNMSLAKELAEKGENETVILYLGMCRTFMTDNLDLIDDWTAMIKGGRKPDFTRNLVY